jgi:hypothetical protein
MTEKELRLKPIKYLEQYIGIKEDSAGHKAILKVFNNSNLCSRYKMTTNDAWCATTVSAAFIACGLAGPVGSGSLFECVECSCGLMISKAQKQHIWKEDDDYVPEIGDVIMYDWDDSGKGDNTGWPEHVGIVCEVKGNSIVVLEGNYSDTVKRRTLVVNAKNIRGYIVPQYDKYATKEEKELEKTEEKTNPKAVKATSSASQFLTSIAGTYKTTADLHCRNGAGIGHKSLVVIPMGTKVKCYGFYSMNGDTRWLYVQFVLNDVIYTGFASSKYLKKIS